MLTFAIPTVLTMVGVDHFNLADIDLVSVDLVSADRVNRVNIKYWITLTSVELYVNFHAMEFLCVLNF